MADAAHELAHRSRRLITVGCYRVLRNMKQKRNDAMGKLSAGMQPRIRLVEQMLSLARQSRA